MQQFTLDFQPGLSDRFPRWEDTLNHAVYASRLGLNGVAARLDQSPSDLSQRLAGADQRPLRVKDAIAIIDATGDLTPVYWLIDKYLKDPDSRSREALARLPGLMAQVEALLANANPSNISPLKRA